MNTTTKTYIETLEEQRIQQAAQQDRINRILEEHGPAATIEVIRQLAAADHAKYPQYNGFWDGDEWTLARATTRIRSKGGIQADTGDVVLYRCNGFGSTFSSEFYSVRLGWMCAAGYGLLPMTSRYTGKPVGR